jgi:hypothetical protein
MRGKNEGKKRGCFKDLQGLLKLKVKRGRFSKTKNLHQILYKHVFEW